jgi:predicted nucleotidyltransferase
MPNLQPLIEHLRREIPSLLAVYVFGSMAAGLARADSDLDLAILAGEKLDPGKLWEIGQALDCAREIDLVDLGEASAVMRMQVISNGRRVFCADRTRCEGFEDFVYSDYARLNEERAGILEDVARRGRIHG